MIGSEKRFFMCDQLTLDEITTKVVQAAKEVFGEKLEQVILYGSYARGDHDDESDVDIMVVADIPHEDCWKEYKRISDLTWSLDLEHDVLVSICITDSDTFRTYASILPFYLNVLHEGVSLIA